MGFFDFCISNTFKFLTGKILRSDARDGYRPIPSVHRYFRMGVDFTNLQTSRLKSDDIFTIYFYFSSHKPRSGFFDQLWIKTALPITWHGDRQRTIVAFQHVKGQAIVPVRLCNALPGSGRIVNSAHGSSEIHPAGHWTWPSSLPPRSMVHIKDE
jgi:hypothetical protein